MHRFWVYNIVSLAVDKLYNRSLHAINFVQMKLSTYWLLLHCFRIQSLQTTNSLSGFMSLTLLDIVCKWNHTVFVFLLQGYFPYHNLLQ